MKQTTKKEYLYRIPTVLAATLFAAPAMSQTPEVVMLDESSIQNANTTTLSMQAIFFASGSDVLTSMGERALLDDVALLLSEGDREATIHGFSSATGDATENLALANSRAQTVRAFFRKYGIEPSRVHVVSHGESHELRDNEYDRRAVVLVHDEGMTERAAQMFEVNEDAVEVVR